MRDLNVPFKAYESQQLVQTSNKTFLPLMFNKNSKATEIQNKEKTRL